MKICKTPTHYILNPDCHNISTATADFLGVAYKSMPNDKECAFDLSIVETCSNKFFKMFEQVNPIRPISLINANERILASLYLMKFDKYVKVFSSDVSLFEDKHEVINRRLSLVAQ